jgi:hypothetical protein
VRVKVVRWPVMLFLAIGVLCVQGQNAYNYLFAPRVHAVVETCGASLDGGPQCLATWTAQGRPVTADIEGAGADTLHDGQSIDVYPVGDLNDVRPDGAGPPWGVWLIALLAAAYLVLVGFQVSRSAPARRDARAAGRRTHRAGELLTLSMLLGLPSVVIGVVLAAADDSRDVGLVILGAGAVLFLGPLAGYLAVNWRPATPPEPTAP